MNSVDENVGKFFHPSSIICSGPSQSGKTEWMKQLIKYKDKLFTTPPQRMIWSYKKWQPNYDDMAQNYNVEFVESGHDIPNNTSKIPTLLIIDDQMHEINDKIVDYFTVGSHHDNITIVFITQNLFFPDKRFRTASLNCHYLILFNNPRDKCQIRHLARQMFPERRESKAMVLAFEDATSQPYGTLVVDLKPNTPNTLRLKSNILPHEGFQIDENTHLAHCYPI